MKFKDLNTLYHCTFRLQYHLVLVTKYRRPCINATMLDRLEEIARATTEKWGGSIIEFSSEADHVHMLLDLTPRIAPSTFVNNLKTVTSRLIRKEFADHLAHYYWGKPAFWSRSYALLSVGGAPLEVLKQYIEQQDAPD